MSESRHIFLVQGSAAEPYEVLIVHEGDDFNAQCSCPAGNMKQLCKHVLGIINYSVTSSGRPKIVSDNEVDAITLYDSFVSSKASTAMNELDDAEKAYKTKEAELKKQLAPLKDAVKEHKKALQHILLL